MKNLLKMGAALLLALAGAVPGMAQADARAMGPVQGIRNFAPESYQADRRNWAIVEDNRGILYFGNTQGVLEFDGVRWRRIALPGDVGVYALGKAKDGRILVGGEGELGWLAPDATGNMVYVSQMQGLPQSFHLELDRVVQILDTPVGEVYVADHWLFVRTPEGGLVTLESEDHFLHAAWLDGTLMVLDSARGLTRYDNGVLHDVAGGGHIRALTMLATHGGLLIPSYNNGLVLYKDRSWQTLHPAGWSDEDFADVTASVALGEDAYALGTGKHGVGLFDWKGGQPTRISTEQGLGDAHVYALADDHRGGLWLALDNGNALLTVTGLNEAGAVPFHSWIRGMVGTRDEKTQFGGAFFAAVGGVPQLMQGPGQHLVFDHKYNAFRLSYAANGLEAKGQMEFQTFVQGVDANWSQWSGRTDREFTLLSPGKWVFKVRARKPGGAISEEATYEMQINPAWWESWWFTVFQVVAVLGVLFLPGQAKHPGLQEALTTFAVIVPFIYIGDWLSAFVNHYYTTEIPILKVLVSSLLAFALDPAQNLLKNFVKKHNHWRRKKRDAAGNVIP